MSGTLKESNLSYSPKIASDERFPAPHVNDHLQGLNFFSIASGHCTDERECQSWGQSSPFTIPTVLIQCWFNCLQLETQSIKKVHLDFFLCLFWTIYYSLVMENTCQLIIWLLRGPFVCICQSHGTDRLAAAGLLSGVTAWEIVRWLGMCWGSHNSGSQTWLCARLLTFLWLNPSGFALLTARRFNSTWLLAHKCLITE